MTISKLATILQDIFTIGKAIASAISDDKPDRVRDVLSDELATTLARAAADIRANQKFGGSGRAR